MRNLYRVRRFLTILAAASLAACGQSALGGAPIDPPIEVASFTFTLPDGSAFSTAPIAGRPTMVFFGYTHCPDVCPLTLADWTRARTQLGDNADRVRWLFVSVDPERDTPAVAQQYAHQFDSTFVGLSGDSATVAGMQRAFLVDSYTSPGATAADYLVTHASQSFLVDDEGQLRTMYSFNSGVQEMVADLQRLLRE